MEVVGGLIEDKDRIVNACLKQFLLNQCYNTFYFKLFVWNGFFLISVARLFIL